MSKGHYESARGTLPYGEAAALFPVADLDATVHQYQDARLALDEADEPDVVVVVPTSMATGYALGSHPLTAIPVASLAAELRAQLASGLDSAIDTFELIQIGRWVTDSRNHSLGEFVEG